MSHFNACMNDLLPQESSPWSNGPRLAASGKSDRPVSVMNSNDTVLDHQSGCFQIQSEWPPKKTIVLRKHSYRATRDSEALV